MLERVPGTDRYRNADEVSGTHTVPGLLIVRLDGPLYFANAAAFADRVHGLVAAAEPTPKEVLLNAEAFVDLDSTAHEVLHELVDDLHEAGIRFSIARAKRPFVHALERGGLADDIDAFHLEVDTAVSAFHERFPPQA